MREPYALLPLLLIAGTTSAQAPTWADDVACIFFSHCTSCHHPGGIAGEHLDLTDYDEANAHRDDIAGYTAYRVMPPWPPDENYRALAHERLITQEEIDIIGAWAAADGPSGDLGAAPPPPVYLDEVEITSPDVTAIMDEYTIPGSSADIYRCFVLPITNTQDNFIKRLEVIPGNREVVHHVLVYQDTTGQAANLDAADPEAGYSAFGGIGVQNAPLIGVWVPGAPVMSTPQGMGIKLFAGADLVIQVHYPANSGANADSTRVNIQFSFEPLTRDLGIVPALYHLPPSLQEGILAIPPNEVKTFNEEFTLPIPATITAIGPHAHLLCQQMTAWAITPAQDCVPLIHIPDWDFHWQGMYEFRKPIYLPIGTVLHGKATYDNTTANEDNPNDPPAWVYVGEATTDEMMLFYFAYTYGFAFDTLIVVDDGAHPDHYMDCETTFNIGVEEAATPSIRIAPVPAQERLVITVPHGARLRLLDATGRELLTKTLYAGDNAIAVAPLARGVTIAEISGEGGTILHRSRLLLQ